MHDKTTEDWFYTETTLRNIVYDKASVWIKEKDWSDFNTFSQLFVLHMLKTPDYLTDIKFKELSLSAREKLVIDAFKLWTTYKVEAGLL